MTNDDKMKYFRFEMAEAMWIHTEVIKPRLYKWVDGIIVQVVEFKRYGALGRLFHFLVEYFYVSKDLGIKITRNQDKTVLAGKGFRKGGPMKFRLDRIRTKVLLRGEEVAQKAFPLGIIIS